MKINIVVIAILCIAPGAFAGNTPDDTLAGRWESAYQRELKQAVAMYAEGDPISKPQMYELARTYLLRQLHSRLGRQLAENQITPGEYDVLKAVFNALIQCNPPGGCDLSCFQGIESKQSTNTFRQSSTSARPSRAVVRVLLMDSIKETGATAAMISYLVGSPFAWEVFSKRLSTPDGSSAWQPEAKRLAQETSKVLTSAAMVTLCPSVSKREIFPTPETPLTRLSQKGSLPRPTGETTPRPVITTLLSIVQSP